MPSGQRIGTLCVTDDQPHPLSPEDLQALQDLVSKAKNTTPENLREAVAAQGAALRPVITTVLTGADLAQARLYMRRGDYEERVLHA